MAQDKTEAKARLDKGLARYIYVPDWENAPKDPPTDGKVPEIPGFSPQLGDVLSWSDHRDTETFIVGKDGKLVPNPDYSDSGYLTIPFEITKHMTDARSKYDGINALYIDLRHDDKFVQENFGELPEEWKFTLDNEEEDLEIKFPNGKMQTFTPGKHTKEYIVQWYEGSQKPQSSFSVEYDLKGEHLKEFKEKYQNVDDLNDKYAWVRARPKIPITWSVETGGGGGGPDRHYGTFHFTGPTEDCEAAITAVKEFFEGFQHTISDPVDNTD